MEIRIATTPEELEQVYRLRYHCYIEELGWKYDQADGKTKELRDPLDATGTIYYVTDGERVVATFCVHFPGGHELPAEWRRRYALDRFAEYPDSVTDLQVLVISREFLQRAMKALPEVAILLLYNLNGILCQKLQKTTNDWLTHFTPPAIATSPHP